jgi:hypothetical protein
MAGVGQKSNLLKKSDSDSEFKDFEEKMSDGSKTTRGK